jgi:glutamate-1-semialdehyde aminotransferase
MAAKLDFTKSLEIWSRAEKVISGGSQTNSKRPSAYAEGAYPIYVERSQGCRVWDVDGNEFIDYVLGLGPITLGYCYPAVDQAIAEQLSKGIIWGLMSPLEVECAERMIEMVPCCEQVRYLKGGSEVTSAAARIARAYTGKEIILNSGYRGWADTWSAQIEPPMGRGIPECLRGMVKTFPRDDLDRLEDLLKRYEGKVAAVFVDEAGGTEAPKAVVQGRRELCDKYGVLLCYDEIVSGFRMAPGGAQEYYGVTPDLACFAKGIANGMPLAAVCGKKEIMQLAADLLISITYGGEALSLAAAVACMREYRAKPVHDTIRAQGQKLVDGFNALGQKNGVPFTAHGPVMMSMQSFGYEDGALNGDCMTLLLQEMAKRGVLIRRGGLLFVTYSHDDAAVAATLEALDGSLAVIREAVDGGKVQDYLQAGAVQESFRRF